MCLAIFFINQINDLQCYRFVASVFNSYNRVYRFTFLKYNSGCVCKTNLFKTASSHVLVKNCVQSEFTKAGTKWQLKQEIPPPFVLLKKVIRKRRNVDV